jgi:transcriptional regulator with XRE-family HTH domain
MNTRASGHDVAIVFSPRVHEVAAAGPEFLPENRMIKKVPNPIDKHVGSRVRMRRMMLGMSQEKLGDALGLTFQQVQKYEKGSNRIGASRLQQISLILQVPVSFFFEGAPSPPGANDGFGEAASPSYVTDFLATTDGLALVKAFMRIPNAKLRRRVVDLVEEMAGADAEI